MTRKARHDPVPQPDLYQGAEATPTTPYRSAATLTPAERERFLEATFGGWQGLVDADQLKRDLNALQRDDAEPRRL